MRKLIRFAPLLALAAIVWPSSTSSAATCSNYSNQAAAQAAKDTRDGDGDGIYCESLPCPCAKVGSTKGAPKARPKTKPKKASCVRTKYVHPVGFSKTRYPNIRRHYLDAVRHGWPRILVVNRKGAAARRTRALREIATRRGFDRDEYPPAAGRGKGAHLARGTKPRGWHTDVEYVPSSENRSHGSRLGIKLRRFCDGQRFKYVFY